MGFLQRCFGERVGTEWADQGLPQTGRGFFKHFVRRYIHCVKVIRETPLVSFQTRSSSNTSSFHFHPGYDLDIGSENATTVYDPITRLVIG